MEENILISQGERVTLIKSIVSSLPKFLSAFPILVGAKRLEKLPEFFFFFGRNVGDKVKYHLVSWDTAC